MLEDYEEAKTDALELTKARTDELLDSFSFERQKRSAFQYEMGVDVKMSKARTSLERAKRFVFEMKKMLK